MAEKLVLIDYLVVVVYLVGTIGLGLAIGARVGTGRDYFLAGRRLPWWAIGMSLVATDIGGTDIVGVGGAAYRHGFAVANFEWIGCVPSMIVAAFLFIPIFWRAGVYTLPEFMERRFNVEVRSALAGCWLIFMACNLGIMLFASGKMMSVLFGWSPSVWILATAVLVGIYTLSGGLAAVVYTDVIQCAVMIGGCLLIVVLGLVDLGGVGGLMAQVQRTSEVAAESASTAASRLSLILPVDTNTPFPWSGILFGLAFVLGPAYWIGNQAIMQRSLGAKSEFEAKAGYVWGALLKNLIPLIIAVPGLIAMVKFPDLKDGDTAFPSLVTALLPVGLRGVFLAAFIAALMSSVDSYLNAAATLLANDFYKRFFRPQVTDSQLLSVGRVATFVLIVWAIAFAFWISRLEGKGIYTIFQTLMAFFQGPAFALILTGVLWRRATGKGAFAGFLSGIACSVGLFALNQPPVYHALGLRPLFQIAEPFLYFSFWAFLVALFVTAAVSLMTAPEPEEKISGLLWRARKPAADADSRAKTQS